MKSSVIKICNNCHRVLSEDDFYWCKDNRSPNGGYKHSTCKRCHNNQVKLWHEDINYYSKWRTNNIEKIRLYDKEWNKKHPNSNKRRCKKSYEKNKDKRYIYDAHKRARKRNAAPNLTELEKKKINLYYKISQYMGPDWEVDHIIPLSKGGLHHPDNLQVITMSDNRKKYNNEDYKIDDLFQIQI